MKTRLRVLRAAAIIFGAALSGLAAEAQPAVTDPAATAPITAPTAYDLPTVVEQALQLHPSLQVEKAQVAEAQARLRQARAGFRPSLGLSLGYTQLQEPPSFTVNQLGTITFGEEENKQASLALRWPILTGGRLQGLNRQARAGVDISQGALARRRQQVASTATTGYYNVFKARGLVQVAADQLTALESQRDDIAKMRERGVATQIDLMRAESAVAAAQEALIRARNGEAGALAALANAIGLPAQQSLSLTENTQQAAADLPVDAAAAIARALQSRPEVLQAMAAEKAALAGIQVARSGRLPEVGAVAQYDAKRPTYMPETGKWSVGVALTLNVFDGGVTGAQVQQAQARVAQAQAATAELRNNISLQVMNAFLNLQSARERAATMEKAVTAAREGTRLVRLGYANGVNTITDYLTAQSELTRAENDRLNALYDIRFAETELRVAMGTGR